MRECRVAAAFVVAAVRKDWRHPAVVSRGKFPIVEPLIPLGGVVAVDHVASEGHKEGAQFCDQAVSPLTRCPVVARVAASDEGKGLGCIRRGAEPITFAFTAVVFEYKVVGGVGGQSAQAGELADDRAASVIGVRQVYRLVGGGKGVRTTEILRAIVNRTRTAGGLSFLRPLPHKQDGRPGAHL